MPTTTAAILALRLASSEDAGATARLAALDSAELPAGPLLLAIVDGTPQAALSLTTGEVVADPFVPTLELVALLRRRAAALATAPGRSHGLGPATGRFRRATAS